MIWREEDLRIIIPEHARLRGRQRGFPLDQGARTLERVVRAIQALRARDDIGAKTPLALLSEDGQKVVFEFRRRGTRAVVATVLGPHQRLEEGTLIFPLAMVA